MRTIVQLVSYSLKQTEIQDFVKLKIDKDFKDCFHLLLLTCNAWQHSTVPCISCSGHHNPGGEIKSMSE